MFSTWLNTCMFLGFSCLLYNQLYFIDVMALVGDNVRAVNESEYPFIASILLNRINKSLSPFCTGILITNKDILTSETCTEYKDPEDIVILIGANNLENRIKYYVEWWKSYNQWSLQTGEDIEIQKYDITLLRLTKKVPNDIVPVALSSVSHRKSWHLEVTAVAWATLSGGVIPHEMEAMDLRILIDSNCELRLSELDRLNTVIQRRIICSVAQPYAFLTYGDAGSPLLYNGELMGVGYQPFFQYAKEFNPGVTNLHFEINYYRHYIEDVISNY
ncbi:PREDICTED: chymotrypsin-2-like [Ceratosolen solmsi marchali]|uniref:Chymotrypsin-2-like n=1 Tax=Ceratosolen solmsi marchali TaxID=326594 RepID=A0AAJ7DYY4_9HYME|nr:PREDICTED: chymotrypsin-2-like [Ceratosolen solmsi marchali]